MADEDCYELLPDGEPSGVIEVPVEWIRDDAVYFLMSRFQSLRRPLESVSRRQACRAAAIVRTLERMSLGIDQDGLVGAQ